MLLWALLACDRIGGEPCEGPTDADGDGWGEVLSECDGDPTQADCDDSDAGVNPGATEICGNGLDDDCDGRGCSLSEAPVAAAKGEGRFGYSVTVSPHGVAVGAPDALDFDGQVELFDLGLRPLEVVLTVDEPAAGFGRSLAPFGAWIAVSSFGWDAPYQPVLLFGWDGDLKHTLDSPSQDSDFGATLVGGRIDEDDSPDLLITDPRGRGAVWLVHGPLTGHTVTSGGRVYGYADEGALGSALVLGDLDSDGEPEMAIGSPGDRRIWVHPDIEDGFAASVDVNGELWVGEEAEGFGRLLATGDLNGDGRQDLVVGSDQRVWVYVILGSSASARIEVAPDALVTADVDGSGRARLLVGSQGEVLLFDQPEGTLEAADMALDGPEDFGRTLAPYDVDEDGADDLFVAAPRAGVLTLFMGQPY